MMLSSNGLAQAQAAERLQEAQSPWDRHGCCKLCGHKRPEAVLEVETAFGPIRLDFQEKKLWVRGQLVTQNKPRRPGPALSELVVLRELLRNTDRCVRSEDLLAEYDSDALFPEKLLKVYICRLRNLLGRGAMGECIKCVWGKGYRFEPFPAADADGEN